LTRPGKDAKPTLSVRHSWGEDLSGTLQGAGGIGGLLASVHQSPNSPAVPLWFHGDSNGNVILLTDERAQPAARYSYDAFGQTITATGPAASVNRYRFSTKPTENGSGLAYYGYRYYGSMSGKWLSVDPLMESGGINLVAMLKNNPLIYFDVLGLIAGGGACHTQTCGGQAYNSRNSQQRCCNGQAIYDSATSCCGPMGVAAKVQREDTDHGSYAWSDQGIMCGIVGGVYGIFTTASRLFDFMEPQIDEVFGHLDCGEDKKRWLDELVCPDGSN
jgi:RHS repeat-associated protein